MKRSQFIKNTLTVGTLLSAGAFPYEALAKSGLRKLTILHTNDQHSRIEPFPMDGGKYQGMGGFAQRADLIKTIRAQEKNVLLLDSGDIWQGTPYFNMFGGSLEFQLMNEMGYDAATLGNHDFDAGIDGLNKNLPLLKFPFLNVNYNFEKTSLQNKIQQHKVFVKDGIKVGVFGVGIELQGLVPVNVSSAIGYNNPITAAQSTADFLKNELKCHLVICLSHLGYKYYDKKASDIVLAENTKNIDFILGGHTHTFFKKPEEFANTEKKKVIVHQVGWAGIYLGKIDVWFEENYRNAILQHVNLPVLNPD